MTPTTCDFLTEFSIVTEFPLVADVSFCQRCHGDHLHVVFTKLLNDHAFWAMCPKTAQPIIWERERESEVVDWEVSC